MSTETGRGFQLGKWRVYPDQCTLESDDGPVHIEPKVMEVLTHLARHQGEVVKRDELLRSVWQGTIVTDEVLSRAISLLRGELGDDRMAPVYIQTLPKIGYRLLMPVSDLPGEEDEPAGSEPNPSHSKVRWAVLAAVALVAASLYFSPDEVPIVTPEPVKFSSISDWFDFLIMENEGTREQTSIAVLPFRNLIEDEQGEIRSDSLTDELMISLSKVKGLKVVSRWSTDNISNSGGRAASMSEVLKVDAILEGSIRQDGEGLRVTAQLSDVSDSYLIWSETFNCQPDELFSLQENLTGNVVRALSTHFTNNSLEAPAPVAAPPDQKAYQLYLQQPNYLWKMRGEGPLRQSIEIFEQAIELDPQFSRARIGLANSLVLLPFYSNETMEPWFQRAEQVLNSHAFTENRALGEVESIHAFMAWHRWHWIEAEERFRRALELAPLSANIYQWYSQHLAYVGRKQDSLAAALRAKELDDVSPAINNRLGVAYLWLNQNSRAIEQFAISRLLGFRNEFNPAYLLVLLRENRLDDFKSAMTAFHGGKPDTPSWLIDQAEFLLQPKHRGQAIELAEQAEAQGQLIKPELQFPLWITLSANDQAYDALYTLRETFPKHLQLEIVFAEEGRSFRDDPRFEALSEEIGWVEYWQTYAWPDKL